MNLYDGLGNSITLDTEDVLRGKTWLPIGDSITNGSGYRPTLTTYKGLTEIKGGYADGRQMGYKSGVQYCALEHLTDIQSGSPDFITIALGTNDYGNDCPIGDITDNPSTQTKDNYTFIGCYRKLIESLDSKYPLTPIILVTPFQRIGGNYKNGANATLEDYANAIKRIGVYYSLEVCDMYSDSGLGIGTLTASGLYHFAHDGLHLVPNAGEVVVPKLIESITRAIKRIKIKASNLSTISNGGNYTLTNTNSVRIYATGDTGTERINWISDNEDIVKVVPEGNYIYANITAVANGSTTIRAICGDITATFNITVNLS